MSHLVSMLNVLNSVYDSIDSEDIVHEFRFYYNVMCYMLMASVKRGKSYSWVNSLDSQELKTY